MKPIVFLGLVLLVASASLHRAHGEDAEDKIRKALSRKISFEFTDTPLVEALDSVRHLCNVSIILDPKIMDGRDKLPISLRVSDMEMEKALQWITKLAELEYKVADQVIYIYPAGQKNDAAKGDKKEKGDDEGEPGMLRAKFATGDSIEADSAMLKRMPNLAREILAMGFDPTKDEILVLVPGVDVPPQVDINTFIKSAKTVAPDAKITFDENLKLLYVQSNDDADLHRVNAIARALRRAPARSAQNAQDANPKISLKVADRPLKQVLDNLATMANVTILAADRDARRRFTEPITLDLHDVEVRECLDMVAQLTELRYEIKESVISFTSAAPKVPFNLKLPHAPEELPAKDKKPPIHDGELQF